jgi:hypothetical protein
MKKGVCLCLLFEDIQELKLILRMNRGQVIEGRKIKPWMIERA